MPALKKKKHKLAKKATRRELERMLEATGHHADEKHGGTDEKHGRPKA